MATNQDTSLLHELAELTDQVQGLLWLSQDDSITPAQLADVQERFDHILAYGKALGFRCYFFEYGGDVCCGWEPIVSVRVPSC
jgi:hypothetical protein